VSATALVRVARFVVESVNLALMVLEKAEPLGLGDKTDASCCRLADIDTPTRALPSSSRASVEDDVDRVAVTAGSLGNNCSSVG
jgi:hypothetical protein